MFREPKAMREIHKIRRQLAKENKGLTIHEIVEKTNRAAEIELERIRKLREEGSME